MKYTCFKENHSKSCPLIFKTLNWESWSLKSLHHQLSMYIYICKSNVSINSVSMCPNEISFHWTFCNLVTYWSWNLYQILKISQYSALLKCIKIFGLQMWVSLHFQCEIQRFLKMWCKCSWAIHETGDWGSLYYRWWRDHCPPSLYHI